MSLYWFIKVVHDGRTVKYFWEKVGYIGCTSGACLNC